MKKLLLAFLYWGMSMQLQAQMPVVNTRPRIMMNADLKASLMAKKNANTPEWQTLLAEANSYSNKPVLTWTPATVNTWDTNYIFYSYQASSWEDAAMPLAFAHLMTKTSNAGANPTAYSNKLMQLADSIMSANRRYRSQINTWNHPLSRNGYYPTRHLGRIIGTIYDWCHDELGQARKDSLIHLMKQWFDDIRGNAYQNNDRATGNYFFGHVFCVAHFGYALGSDDPRSQEMIDWARIRFDGTPSPNVEPQDIPDNNLADTWENGYMSYKVTSYGFPVAQMYTGLPSKGGLQIQGWSYGSGNNVRILDYMALVKMATGEDLVEIKLSWIQDLVKAIHHSLLPNAHEVDHDGDWGDNYGPYLNHHFSERLAFVLEGKPFGEQAQYFQKSEYKPFFVYGNTVNGLYNWEKFYFPNTSRPSAPLDNQLWYSGFNQGYNLGIGNRTSPVFLMRNKWADSTATWAVFRADAATYDDHKHFAGGSFEICRGGSYILTNASNVGRNGYPLMGDNTLAENTGANNTLYFNDFGDYQQTGSTFIGGQGYYGKDDLKAVQMDDSVTYVRTDLSSYYDKSYYPEINLKKINYFIRGFLYLRSSNLFLSYDQISVKNSTNPQGQYKKHLRWHFLKNPVVSGNLIKSSHRGSDIYVKTLIPANPDITVVDESNNPDNTSGSIMNYYFNSPTWRTEVKYADNPLDQIFLTVLQPTIRNTTAPIIDNINSTDGKMKGAIVTANNGKKEIAFFNTDLTPLQAGITITHYTFPNSGDIRHTICGVIPNAKYLVTVTGDEVNIVQDANGNRTASIAGVLQFMTTAVPCPNEMTFSNTITTGNYKTGNSISTQNGGSTQIQNGANVTFDAAKAIILNHTFEAQSGSVFKAQIGGCN